jgi:hypothetical protein
MSILVLTSDTLIGTPATGNLEYNGQFYGTDSALSRAQMQRITLATAVASTSGTSIDFTSLPAWVKRITVNFNGVSTNGTSNLMVQLGSGSVTTSGYNATSTGISSAVSSTQFTTGIGLTASNAAANSNSGVLVFTLLSAASNTWCAAGANATVGAAQQYLNSGNVTLAGTLDRVRFTTFNGTDAFDAGSVNILYEG